MAIEWRYKFHGYVDGGKFHFKEREKDAWDRIVKQLFNQDVEIILQQPEKDRSDQQRKYYYGVIVKRLCEVSGYDKDDMNEILAKRCLSFEISMKDGCVETFYRRPSSLNTKETELFHEKCRQFAMSEYQVYIPLPNEVEGQYDWF